MSRHPSEQLKRAIPSSGELVPAVGLGTYSVFDVNLSGAQGMALEEVLRLFIASGGSVIDSSPMYGSAEQAVGKIASAQGISEKIFFATKVWTSGREAGIRQMEHSFRLFRTTVIDLMQVHNLVDWETHLRTITSWKEQGRIRYSGITHYSTSSFALIERVMNQARPDFIQIYYSIQTRQAEERLLPLARDLGIGVIVNRPLETSGLFGRVRDKRLPAWAHEIGCSTWSQFFLKYVLAHPAVTVVVPATGNPEHLKDNMQAGLGPMPDGKMRQQMVQVVEKL